MDDNRAHRIVPYIPWLTAYAVAAGTLYLWGYWSKFHVNILEYIGLLDLATAAAFPLVTAMVGIVGGIALGQFFGRDKLPLGRGRDTPVGRVLNRHTKLLLFIYLTIVLVGFPLLGTPDTRAFAVPLALFPLVSIAVTRGDFLSDVIPDDSTRATVITILTFVLCSAFGHGRNSAVSIVTGQDYLSINAGGLPDAITKQTTQKGEFKYLGHAGDYMFALGPDSSIMVLRAETVPSLTLTHRTTMRPWPPWRKNSP